MISVVIPAYNEENAITHTLTEICQVLEDNNLKPYEIILVDDGSSDKTAEVATMIDGVQVVRNPHNMGYGFSLKRGITAAKYEMIAITDADLTYPFEYVPKMVELKNQGFDLIVGARTGKNYDQSFLKKMLRRILKMMVEFVAGRKIPDINSGLRVFDKSTVSVYFSRLCDTFSFSTSQTLAYMMNGKFVTYLDIPYNKREGKSKVKLLKDSKKTLQYILEASIYYAPLKIFTLFSEVLIVLAIIGFCVSHFGGLRVGYLLGIGGLITSLLVFCIGILAVLLKQIMDK